MQLDPLTRETIEAGGIDAMVARDAPAVRILSEAERKESLRRTLTAKPRGAVWLFGYGSLIWNPTVRFAERRVARVTGWHRAFCLATPAGRGRSTIPGWFLNCKEGHCEGVAFRISADIVESELATVEARDAIRRIRPALARSP